MSVYTFMGDGLLKKDNDLTLSVIEETLNVLFSTVMNEKVGCVYYLLVEYVI